ncbi:hypothetical protein FIBSPDRAFT_869078 [Athelia psychrophila]|uniref:Uncharacterized protein n=1 Tax=Athelia psychrophila TaxID=1759441 RepID=A0A166CHV8_9AGAM|nr:hypothetical protein FIBSPDRAFT_869078 [Fibularhizoctonia sp. CBS 109695]
MSDATRSEPARAITKRAPCILRRTNDSCTCERIVEVAGRGGFAESGSARGDVDGSIIGELRAQDIAG